MRQIKNFFVCNLRGNEQMDENALEPSSILGNYVNCLNLLREAIDGLQASELDLSRKPGEWSIREIIHHLVDGDYIWKICIQMALGEGKRPFHLKWYWETEQVRWSQLWGYSSREIEPSLALFTANRNHTVELLRKIDNSLSRTITIEWPGGSHEEVNIGWVLEMQTKHVEDHVEEIRRIREVSHGS
jgi:hypothetical protein